MGNIRREVVKAARSNGSLRRAEDNCRVLLTLVNPDLTQEVGGTKSCNLNGQRAKYALMTSDEARLKFILELPEPVRGLVQSAHPLKVGDSFPYRGMRAMVTHIVSVPQPDPTP